MNLSKTYRSYGLYPLLEYFQTFLIASNPANLNVRYTRRKSPTKSTSKPTMKPAILSTIMITVFTSYATASVSDRLWTHNRQPTDSSNTSILSAGASEEGNINMPSTTQDRGSFLTWNQCTEYYSWRYNECLMHHLLWSWYMESRTSGARYMAVHLCLRSWRFARAFKLWTSNKEIYRAGVDER